MLAASSSNDFFVAKCHGGPVPFEKIELQGLKNSFVLPNTNTSKPKSQGDLIPTSKQNLVSIKPIVLFGASLHLLNGSAYFTSR